MTVSPARSKIPGTDLTDFIELGATCPFSDLYDAANAFTMLTLVFFSIIKFGLLIQGEFFITLNLMPEWNI